MEQGCTLDISFFVLLKGMEAEFWKYWSKNSLKIGSVYSNFVWACLSLESIARCQFIRNLCETSGYEHLVVGNLVFLQVFVWI